VDRPMMDGFVAPVGTMCQAAAVWQGERE
jgi:hypothetical protein